ncbi:MAG: CaiB/BaiF CoA-transferase family protein, partial [Bacteroidota bacterium]
MLSELFVLDLSSVLAGPAVGMFFAELGARVVKIENPKTQGDVTRSWKLPQEDPSMPDSAYHHSINWGKDIHFLDIADPSNRPQVEGWIQQADIVLTNFKPGSEKKLGLDYPTLAQLNPRLIHASVNAYGADNPRPGFDALIQAETGWMYMNGEADGPPVKLPVALIDVLAAHQLKQGILLALLQRERSGTGSQVQVSLFDASLAALTNQASNWLNVGVKPTRKGSQHPNIAPYGDIFSTQDGRDILLGTGTQRQFEQLCHLLAVPDLATDPRFLTNRLRLQHRSALIEALR